MLFLAYVMVHNICHVICLRLLTVFLESDPKLHCFCKLSLSWELGSSLWSSEHAGYKEERVFSRKMHFSFNPQQEALDHILFFPEVNEFLSKTPPISRTFLKHKWCWTFNIVQCLGVRQNLLKTRFTFENFLGRSCFIRVTV